MWVAPDLDEEYGEFERVVEEGYVSDLPDLLERAKNGKLISLNLEDPRWRNMENSDSGQDLTIDEAREIAESYGRDINPIIEGIKRGDPIPAPIILELPDGSLHNIAGNTRLMVCRALGINPKVWWVSMKDSIASRVAARWLNK
jgi:hypothetical protein